MKISVVLEMLTAQFETDSKRAQKLLDKAAAEIGESAKRAGLAVGAGLAGAATALAALAQQAINTADKMGEAADRTGASVEALSKLAYAAKMSGTSFEAVEKGLQKIAREADAGGKNLERIGVAVADSTGRLRPMEEVLLDVADRFQNMDSAAERAAIAQAAFGKAGAELIPLLSRGRDGLEQMGMEAERLGVVFSRQAADAAGEFNDRLDQLKMAATGLGNDIAAELLPSLLDVTRAAVDFVGQLREDGTLAAWVSGVREAVGALDELAVFIATRLVAGALVSLVAGLGSVTAAFNIATVASRAFTLSVAVMGGPLGILLTALAAGAVAVYAWAGSMDEAEQAASTLRDVTERLSEAQDSALPTAIAAAEAARDQAKASLEQARSDLAAAEARQKLNEQMAASLDGPRGEPGAGAALGGAGIGVALSAAEVERLRGQILELEQAIGSANGEIAAGDARLEQYREALATVREESVRLTPRVDAAAEAAKKLAEETARAEDERFQDYLRSVADAASAAADELVEMERSVTAELAGPGQQAIDAWAAAILRAKAALDIMRQSAPLTAEDIARFTNIAIAQTEKLGRALDDIDAQQEETARRADTVANRVAASWDSAMQQTSYAIGDLLTGQLEDWDDFADAVKQIWLRALADMIAASVQADLLGPLMSGASGFPGLGGGGGAGGLLGGLGGPIGSLISGYGQFLGPLALLAGAATGDRGSGAIGGALGGFAFASSTAGAGMLGGALSGMAGASGTIMGMQLGSVVPVVGTIIGAVLGTVLSDLFADDPLLRVRSSEFSGPRRSEGRATSALGDIFVRTEDLGDGAPTSPEIAQKIADFDNLLAGFLSPEQLESVRARLSNVNDTFRDGSATLEAALGSRFSAVLSTMSDSVQAFVAEAGGGLEDRVRALSDALSIERIAELGTVGDTFEEVSGFLLRYRNGTEELAATYNRVSQSMALLESILEASGAAVDMTREQLAEFAVEFTEAAGGVDRAAGLWSSFVETFYSAQERAEMAVDAARRQAEQFFEAAGLDLEGYLGEGGLGRFRADLEAALPTLSPEQLVQWLEAAAALGVLTDALAAISGEVPPAVEAVDLLGPFMANIAKQLEEFAPPLTFSERIAAITAETEQLIARAVELGATEEQLALIRELGAARLGEVLSAQDEVIAAQVAAAASLSSYLAALSAEASGGVTPLTSALMSLRAEYDQHVERINEMARASGRASASAEELAVATAWLGQRMQQLIADLLGQASSIIAQLYGGGGSALPSAPGASPSAPGGESTWMGQVQAAMETRYEEELRYLEQIRDFVNGLSLSSLSPLTPEERLAEAERQYRDLLARAQAGDVDALAQLREAAQTYLQEAQSFFGGVGAYGGIFGDVTSALSALVALGPQQQPGTPQVGGGGGGGGGSFGGGVVVEPGDGFVQLSVAERLQLAEQLVEVLRDLMSAQGTSLAEVSAQLGLDLRALVEDLGVSLDDLTVESAGRLTEIARALGVELSDLAASVGVDLGGLADAQSLLNDALEQVISGLPEGFREQLQGYLQAIEDATNEADANAAIAAAEAEIEKLPPFIRDALAPFFEDVSSPTDQLLATAVDQAANVASIDQNVADILANMNNPGPPEPPGPPPPEPVSAVVVELQAVREELEALRRERKQADRVSAEQMDTQTAELRKQGVGPSRARSF